MSLGLSWRNRAPVSVGRMRWIIAVLIANSLCRIGAASPPDAGITRTELAAARDSGDVVAMRRFAWHLFQEVVEPVSPIKVRWETWPTQRSVLRKKKSLGPENDFLNLGPARMFVGADDQPRPSASAPRLLFVDVRFNEEAAKHIAEEKLADSTMLEAMRTNHRGKIPPFSPESIAVKAVWWPVQGIGVTAVPVWDGVAVAPIESGVTPDQSADPYGNDFSRWNRLLAIDPALQSVGCGTMAYVKEPSWRTLNIPHDRPTRIVPAVSLAQFYHRTLSDEEVKGIPHGGQLDLAFNSMFGRSAQAGDELALVGLHVAAKRLDDWIWMTFWWHDRADTGEFAANRPAEIQGPWRNYLMDVTFSGKTPLDSDGHAKPVFNPWLEGALSYGLRSNCLVCHQRAAWGGVPSGREGMNVTFDVLSETADYFKDRLQLDYMWSLARPESQR